MMYFKILFALASFVFVVSLAVSYPMQAQDGSSLSEEEIAAIDRVFSVIELEKSYQSYEALSLEIETSVFTIYTEEEDFSFSQSKTLGTDGYFIRTEDGENYIYDISLSYAELTPNEIIDYAINGKFIGVNDIIYVDVSYSRANDDVPELPVGWQIIESEAQIPEAFEQLELDDYLDDDVSAFFQNRDALVEFASSVTVQQKLVDTEDGDILVDEITIVVDGESLAPYFLILQESDTDSGSDLLAAIFTDTELTGELKVIAEFTEDGNIRLMQNLLQLSTEDMDAASAIPDLPAGSTLDWSTNINKIEAFTNINGEFEPIVAPE